MERTRPGPTLEIDGVVWTRVDSLVDSGPNDHHYVQSIDPETGASSLRFGDGTSGARLPDGTGNVTANYRSGAGDRGNQPADSGMTLIEALAAAGDILADAQDRVAEEAYLSTVRVRRRRRKPPGEAT
jgi:hypothetical protein